MNTNLQAAQPHLAFTLRPAAAVSPDRRTSSEHTDHHTRHKGGDPTPRPLHGGLLAS
jgi:hypothetical protein